MSISDTRPSGNSSTIRCIPRTEPWGNSNTIICMPHTVPRGNSISIIYRIQGPEGTPALLCVYRIAYRYFPDISRYFRFPNVQLVTSLDTLSLSAVRFLGLMSAQGACGWQSSEWHGSRSDVHHAVSLRARLRFPEGMFRCTNYPPAVRRLRHAKGAR